MKAHAIVIGIDEYAVPDWRLEGAACDALRFAAWAIRCGGVAVEDLHLLIAPHPDLHRTEQAALLDGNIEALDRNTQPTADAIAKIKLAYTHHSRGKGADRLWFFYAGHGVTAPADMPDAGPIMVPCDQSDLELYLVRPIGIESFRDEMQVADPREQVYFVDACRTLTDRTSAVVLKQVPIWVPDAIGGPLASQVAVQAALFSTCVGEAAAEVRGAGLFTTHLLDGLAGIGPTLGEPVSLQDTRQPLDFGELTKFVEEAVSENVAQLRVAGSAVPIQATSGNVRRNASLVVATIDPADLTEFEARACVEPDTALGTARVEAMDFNHGSRVWTPRSTHPAPVAPPLERPTTLRVPCGPLTLRVTAPGYREWSRPFRIYRDRWFDVMLEPVEPGEVRRPGPDDAPSESGSVVISTADPWARITVADGGGKVLCGGFGHVRIGDLTPGPLRVSGIVDLSIRGDEDLTVESATERTYMIELPASPIAPALAIVLQRIGLTVDPEAGVVSGGDGFGPIVGLDLSSTLAHGAWAARWPADDSPMPFRRLGVAPVAAPSTRTPPGTGGVQVLVGSATTDPTAVVDQITATLHQPLLDDQPGEDWTRPGQTLSFEQIGEVPFALQATAITTAGQYVITTAIADMAPLRLPLTVLEGMDTILILAQEVDGGLAVQQLIIAQDLSSPQQPDGPYPEPDDIRHLDLMGRGLRDGRSLEAWELAALERAIAANPFLGLLTAYRALESLTPIWLDGALRVDVTGRDPEHERRLDVLLDDLRSALPELPDTMILRGMRSGSRAELEAALSTGTPIIAAGFRAGFGSLTSSAAEALVPPPQLDQTLVPDLTWTAFAGSSDPDDGIVTISRTGRVQRLRPDSDELVNAASAVCRIETGGEQPKVHGTAFLVAPDLILCPAFVFLRPRRRDVAKGTSWIRDAIGRYGLEPGPVDPDLNLAAVFTNVGGEISVRMTEVVGVMKPVLFGLPQDRPNRWLVVVRLGGTVPIEPLSLLATRQRVGDPIAVIGFPTIDQRLPEVNWAFASTSGRKHVMLGSVVRPAPDKRKKGVIHHDALTSHGVGGGPVLAITSGKVRATAVHDGGSWQRTTKLNMAESIRAYDLDQLRGFGIAVDEE